MSGKNSKSLSYVFTINNPTDDDHALIETLGEADTTRYLIVGREIGEEGTPHLQCYIYFTSQRWFTALKKALPRAHIEFAKGSVQQNIDYCSKDNDYTEYGTPPMSQKRKGEKGKEFWDDIVKKAKTGDFDNIDSKVLVSHFPNLLKLHSHYSVMPEDLVDIDNDWYCGPTGTGKSYKARTDNPGYYLKMCNKWWDGYQNEEVVIMEDFDKSHKVLGHHVKIWADRYAFPAEIKGSKVNLRPKKIIVTSNWSPSDIWGDEPQTLDPILRRFKVSNFTYLTQ